MMKTAGMHPVAMRRCVSWACGWAEGFSSHIRLNDVEGMATRQSLNGAHFKDLVILCNTLLPRSNRFVILCRLKNFLE